MATRNDRHSVTERWLGTLGLAMIRLTVWAVARQEGRARLDGALAWLALTGVGTVGWLVDRVPQRSKPAPTPPGSASLLDEMPAE